jgi:hypothetical protein
MYNDYSSIIKNREHPDALSLYFSSNISKIKNCASITSFLVIILGHFQHRNIYKGVTL